MSPAAVNPAAGSPAAGSPGTGSPGTATLYRVAAGIVRQGAELLLVEQVTALGRYWSLPGGVAEDGESAAEALRRELLEEAGVRADALALAYVTEVHASDSLTVACVFDVVHWALVAADDPDPAGEVVSREFVAPDALEHRLATLDRPSMTEPLLEHIAGTGGRYHVYRGDGSRQIRVTGYGSPTDAMT